MGGTARSPRQNYQDSDCQGWWNVRRRPSAKSHTKLTSLRFRWVACQIQLLKEYFDPQALDEALQSLPKTLNETYTRILDSIPPSYLRRCIRTLQFLVYSTRPLKLEEVVDAICVDVTANATNSCRFNPMNRMPVPVEITRYCSSLVVCNLYYRAVQLSLAPFSVREFLSMECNNEKIAEHMEARTANNDITKVCLTYLLQASRNQSLPINNEHAIKKDYPLSVYSARHWTVHAAALRLIATSWQSWLLNFLPALDSWVWCCLGFVEYGVPFQFVNALYYVSLAGIPCSVGELLEQGADVNAAGGVFGSALQAAVSKEHRKVAEILLDKGADVNAFEEKYGSPLHFALKLGRVEMMEMLLDKGADVHVIKRENGTEGENGNALQIASWWSSTKVVKIVLDKGADVNTFEWRNGSALQIALWRGWIEIAEILLDKGADVNASEGRYGSALQYLVQGGSQEIIELLLDKGANINTSCGECSSALQTASEWGREDIVEILLNKGANVNIFQEEYGRTLQAASLGGSKEIEDMLLDKGADANTRGGYYGSALQAAAFAGHLKIVERLLGQGANVNASGGGIGSALQVAQQNNHREVVLLLLKAGAETGCSDS